MSAGIQLATAALDNQAFALMSRLHVILRREKGRITDIEYMRANADYCRHILAFAEKLQVNDDLNQICERLKEIYFGPDGLLVAPPPRQPLLQRKAAIPAPPADAGEAEVPTQHKQPAAETGVAVDNSYIGRLR